MTTYTLATSANQLQHEIDRCTRLVEVEERDPAVITHTVCRIDESQRPMVLVPICEITKTYADRIRLQIRIAESAIDDEDTHAMVRALARLRECR